ncbi:hypothetical protein NDQ71_15360 [Pseudoalteromonas sp. KG3]|uniref:hypothetical protein n=1 Tax=Pseudoalteromonas sp. KG3 TaxID=2951137 RepID=UPI00265A6129|nr:hypothetical protein [Pseudoalteromonas sp. KG3]WKD22988.1 hypothetical protein NDQ71_15360 [Pseudoalteromonas sp. KG3]
MSARLSNSSYIDSPCQGLQSWAAQLVDLAKHRGVHPDKLLKGTKLFYQDFAAGTASLSVEQFYRFLNSSIKCNHYAATRTSDCPVNNS